MLRRRIFASAMASVMAISSVAVIASADETAEAVEAAKNVKSQDDLKKLVEDNEAMRNDGIYDYGSVSGQNFLDALEYADNVLDDAGSTASDYTVAYKMVEEAKAALHIYSAEDLKALIDGCKKIYDTDNIMNEELGDLIYEDKTDTVSDYKKSYTYFADSYDAAERALNSTDTRIITDAYDTLADAKANLKALPSVTKAQFRAVMKSYEALSQKTKDFDGWRRGKVDGWVNVDSGNYWIFSKNKYQTYEDMLNVVFGSGAVTKKGDWWGEVVVKGATGISHSETTNTCVTTVADFINEQYKYFTNVKESNKTTRDDIVKAYRAAQDALDVFATWTADDTTRATKSSVKKLLDQYHNQLVAVYQTSAAEKLYKHLTGKTSAPSDWTVSASLKNDGEKKSIFVDANGYWAGLDADGKEIKTDKDVSVAKRVDILKYVEVKSGDVNNNERLEDAMLYAELYLAEAYSDTVFGLDEIGNINTANGSVAEWTLVYRNLKYALEDAFPAADDTTYTKADVKELINKCYDLADLTGDSAIFNDPTTYHTSMVQARQVALDWLRDANADKTYKEGDPVNSENPAANGMSATAMYKYLENFYKALNEEYAKYKYSYGEIYDYISDVSEMIDDEELVAKDELVKALKDTAYCLSVLKATHPDNEAFTSDREFNRNNRLFTYEKDGSFKGNSYEKALKEAYEALVAAVKAQTEATAVLGDINGDGVVTAADASEILKAVVGLRDAIANEVGDYNNDGAVTAADASAILKAVIGL